MQTLKTRLVFRRSSFHIIRFRTVGILWMFVLVGLAVAENEPIYPKLVEDECINNESLNLSDDECDFPDKYTREKGLRTAAIVGIVAGSLALAAAFGILLCFCFGCLCFKKHFYRRNKTEVLSATVRSNHRSQHTGRPGTNEVPSNNETKIVIEPVSNPTFIDPRRNEDPQNVSYHYNNRQPLENTSTLPTHLYRRSSEDNSAYWGGYEDSLNGENIYSEPEYANESSAPPSYHTNYDNHRHIAVIDGAVFHQGMNNHQQPPFFERDNRGFVSSSEQFQSASAPLQVNSNSKLTVL